MNSQLGSSKPMQNWRYYYIYGRKYPIKTLFELCLLIKEDEAKYKK